MDEIAGPGTTSSSEVIRVRGHEFGATEIVDVLTPFVSDERRARIEAVIAERTYTVVPVVEGLYDLGNVSAVMRTAEALGYQSMHVIGSSDHFRKPSRVTQGADKWIDVIHWETAEKCVLELKNRGYRVVVTHLDANVPLDTVDFTEPTALVFGNEAEGISAAMLRLADCRCVIPMTGFVESFNISVAAAIGLHGAFRQRVERLGKQGDLKPEQLRSLRAAFFMKSVREYEAILNRAAHDRSNL